MNRSSLLGIGGAVVIVAATAFVLVATPYAETGPGAWRHYRQTSGDNRPWPEASVDETGGPGWMVVHCSGAFGVFFHNGRGDPRPVMIPTSVRYRLDDGAVIVRRASFSGDSVWFDEVSRGDDDPLVPQIERARRLAVQVTPDGEPHFVMNFDLSQAGPAVQRLRRECAERG